MNEHEEAERQAWADSMGEAKREAELAERMMAALNLPGWERAVEELELDDPNHPDNSEPF